MKPPKIGPVESVRRHYRERDRLIRSMGFPSYRAYLSSMEWRAIRADKLRDEDECAVCGSEAQEVHHLSYCRAALDGSDPTKLASLCSGHHHAIEFDPWGRKRSPIQAAKRLKQLIAERRF